MSNTLSAKSARHMSIGHQQPRRRGIYGRNDRPAHMCEARQRLTRPQSPHEAPKALVRVRDLALEAPHGRVVDLVNHPVVYIVRELKQAPTTKMKLDQKKDLRDCITYFGNHLHQMRYARYVENGIPIGSGVTEAACKTLVKQRLCFANALDPRGRAQIILSLRALVLTETRWEQFWQINQYGVPEISIPPAHDA
jgi:hypothetical protein